jgi:hypothetical protein
VGLTARPRPLGVSRYTCVYWVDRLYDWNPVFSIVHPVDLQDCVSVENGCEFKLFMFSLLAVNIANDTVANMCVEDDDFDESMIIAGL